jgi:hypothetical protein
MAALLGMLTGIGGGMVRDVLLAQVPIVLRSDLYAVAALAGAAVVAIGSLFNLTPAMTAIAGALLCFALRMPPFTAPGNCRRQGRRMTTRTRPELQRRDRHVRIATGDEPARYGL